jgi:nucleotide-binding universal stress UspA family protein
MYKRILVPIDGSDTRRAGLAEAIALARELKATVRLLNLTSDFVLMVEMSSAIDYDKFREGLNQFGRRLLAQGERTGQRARRHRRDFAARPSAAAASPMRSSRKPARAAAT